jgi:hypothetical protein
LQIGARAEGPTGTGEHDDADVVVGVARAVGVVELVAHLGAERVEDVGPVEREHRDAVGDLDDDVGLAHRATAFTT